MPHSHRESEEILHNRKAEDTKKNEKNQKNQSQTGKCALLPNKTFCERDLAPSRNAGQRIWDYFRLN